MKCPLENLTIRMKKKKGKMETKYSSIKCKKRKIIGHSIILFGCLQQCESIICQEKKIREITAELNREKKLGQTIFGTYGDLLAFEFTSITLFRFCDFQNFKKISVLVSLLIE